MESDDEPEEDVPLPAWFLSSPSIYDLQELNYSHLLTVMSSSQLAHRTPIYDDGDISVLQAVAEHMKWFTNHPGISKEALSDQFFQQHHYLLPRGNHLPSSYTQAMKIIEPLLIKPVVYHVCQNDCVIFKGEISDSIQCPVCQSDRYKDISNKLPYRTFIYLPIGPKIKRLYGDATMGKLLQQHCNSTESSKVYDIHQSSRWHTAYSSTGLFSGDKRGISLALCTDGVNPFSHNRVLYSMWPIILTILNLPRKIRNLYGNMILAGIIPGNGSKEPKNISNYLEILVDELLLLNGTEVRTH